MKNRFGSWLEARDELQEHVDVPLYAEKYKSESWLEEKYWGEGLTMSEVGEEAGVCMLTIRNWMEHHDIPRRPVGKDGIPADELLDDLDRVRDIVERRPSCLDYRQLGAHSDQTLRSRFGSWQAAIDAAAERRE